MAASSRNRQFQSDLKPREEDIEYTVFIRLPFARGDFVDPPIVDWDSEKDRELWKVLSLSSAKGQDLDWNALAERYGVSLDFLSQQAAWLYERHLAQVRAQLRKVNRPASASAASTPSSASGSGTVAAGGHAMSRGGSNSGRAPSALSTRAPIENKVPLGEDGTAEPLPSRGSRRSSDNTVTAGLTPSPVNNSRSPVTAQGIATQRRPSSSGSKRALEWSPKYGKPEMERIYTSSAIDSGSSSSEEEQKKSVSQSRVFGGRTPRQTMAKPSLKAFSDEEEEAEESLPFLPFSDPKAAGPHISADPGATLKLDTERSKKSPERLPGLGKEVSGLSEPPGPSSSSSSAQSQSRPQHRKTLAALSPRQRQLTREAGSEGTPSMGSSFSDLDDVSQSALEEALAGEMQHGGMVSRMSTISQALKSRYL